MSKTPKLTTDRPEAPAAADTPEAQGIRRRSLALAQVDLIRLLAKAIVAQANARKPEPR